MNIEGFVPIIIQMTPIGNFPLYLGMVDENDDPIGTTDYGYNLDPQDRKARFEMNELI